MLVPLCLALSLTATTVAGDPVVGVWKGRASGGESPPDGVPATLRIEREASDAVTARITLQGLDTLEATGAFDPDEGRLLLEGVFQAVPFEVDVTVGDDVLSGKMAGKGIELGLEARRVSREVLTEPPAPSRPVDLAQLTDEDWTEDLRFLEAYLPQVHIDAFHTRSEEEWGRAIDELVARLDQLDGPATAIAAAQLLAGVGDAHTELNWRELPGFDSFPIGFTSFSDGLFVTSVDARWADALATRVVRIGTVETGEAIDVVTSLFAEENGSWRRAKAPALLVLPRLLWILGALDSPEALAVTVEPAPGEELELVIEREGDGTRLSAPDPAYDPIPLWLTRTNENYWYEVLPDASTVYVAYNRCAQDPRRPMGDFMGEVLAAVESSSAGRLVIDLRHNSGGNSAILSDHIAALRDYPRLAESGRLVALIGSRTYSSGMMNAHQLREWAGATLIGEPTGGKPNSYGELRSFRLPKSGLAVYYSTKYFRMLADSDPPAVEPDVLVELDSERHFSGADPVLRRALE